MRRAADIPNVSAMLVAKTSFYRIPQVTEGFMPFCVLIAAMSCYLNLSRRLELVVARSAGVSAWQFISPALVIALVIGVARHHAVQPGRRDPARTVQAPRGRAVRPDQAKVSAAAAARSGQASATTTGRRSSTPNRAAIRAPNSAASPCSSSTTTGVFKQRIEARSAVLHPGVWFLLDAHVWRPAPSRSTRRSIDSRPA